MGGKTFSILYRVWVQKKKLQKGFTFSSFAESWVLKTHIYTLFHNSWWQKHAYQWKRTEKTGHDQHHKCSLCLPPFSHLFSGGVGLPGGNERTPAETCTPLYNRTWESAPPMCCKHMLLHRTEMYQRAKLCNNSTNTHYYTTRAESRDRRDSSDGEPIWGHGLFTRPVKACKQI